VDSWTKLIYAVAALLGVLLGKQSIYGIFKLVNERKKEVRERKLQILNDFNKLIDRLESSAYGLMGDFRTDRRFLAVTQYLSEGILNKIGTWIPSQDLPQDSDTLMRETQNQIYEELILELKKSSVGLESEWFSNPKSKFSRFRRKFSS
jgi:hypothetical protein